MLGKISISESNGRNSTRSLAIISQTEVCAIVRISIHNFITEYFPQPADLINIRWCWFLDWRDTTNGLLPLQNYYLFIAGCVWMSVSSRAHLLGELVWKMVCRGFFFHGRTNLRITCEWCKCEFNRATHSGYSKLCVCWLIFYYFATRRSSIGCRLFLSICQLCNRSDAIKYCFLWFKRNAARQIYSFMEIGRQVSEPNERNTTDKWTSPRILKHPFLPVWLYQIHLHCVCFVMTEVMAIMSARMPMTGDRTYTPFPVLIELTLSLPLNAVIQSP